MQEKQAGVTAAGTAPELNRIPFYSTLHGHQRCSKDKLKIKKKIVSNYFLHRDFSLSILP